MSVPVIEIRDGRQASGVKSREFLLFCSDINAYMNRMVLLSKFSATIKELVIGGSR